MNARNYLEQVIKIDKVIKNKAIEYEQWHQLACSISAGGSTGDRVQASGSKQKMADAVIRAVEIEEEIKKYCAKLADTKQEIVDTIEQLDSASYDILHNRYIQGKDLVEIADMYGKPVATIKRKQGKALKKLQAILDERQKNA